MKAGRIIVNSPSTHGAIGDIYNTNMPSLTLGCGSFGGNSTTANVSSVNLINIKRVAKRRVNMQWFKIPEKIYFESGSISYLEKMPNILPIFSFTESNGPLAVGRAASSSAVNCFGFSTACFNGSPELFVFFSILALRASTSIP